MINHLEINAQNSCLNKEALCLLHTYKESSEYKNIPKQLNCQLTYNPLDGKSTKKGKKLEEKHRHQPFDMREKKHFDNTL